MASISKWSRHISNHVSYFCLLRASDPSLFIKLSLLFVILFMSESWNLNGKKIHMHLHIINTKIKIFRDFHVFILSLIPKCENSKFTEMPQNCHNTQIWECSFKNSWDALQITSTSKWFTYISSQVPGACLLRASNPSRLIKLSSFLLISVFALKKLKSSDQKIGPYVFEICRFKDRDFPWFPVFHFKVDCHFS